MNLSGDAHTTVVNLKSTALNGLLRSCCSCCDVWRLYCTMIDSNVASAIKGWWEEQSQHWLCNKYILNHTYNLPKTMKDGPKELLYWKWVTQSKVATGQSSRKDYYSSAGVAGKWLFKVQPLHLERVFVSTSWKCLHRVFNLACAACLIYH